MSDNALLERVVSDTIHHVRESADPELHRSTEHIDNVIRPHLLRIEQLLGLDGGQSLSLAIVKLEKDNALAAESLAALMELVCDRGIEACLNVCLGNVSFKD